MELQDIPWFLDDPGRMQCIRERHGLKRGQPSQTTAYLAEVWVKWAIKNKITDENRFELCSKCRVSKRWIKHDLPNKLIGLKVSEIQRAHWKYCYEGLPSMVKYIRSRPWKID